MKKSEQRRVAVHVLLAAGILTSVLSVVLLLQTFAHYNDLSRQRQDRQIQDTVRAADESIAVMMNNFREDFSYVLGRRGFLQAETDWLEKGETEDLLFRMSENLISQNPYVHAMLAMLDGEVFLSTDGCTDYRIAPADGSGLHLCTSPEGRVSLALLNETERVGYAVLLDVSLWFSDLSRTYSAGTSSLMLLSGGQLLLHTWQGTAQVSAAAEAQEGFCDLQALRLLEESHASGEPRTESYSLVYPGSDFVHDMRMTVLPLSGSVNGLFTVGITCDYDEIVRPMQTAALQLMIYGGLLVLGLLLVLIVALYLVQRNRLGAQELSRLRERNAETRQLLEQTQALAHHQRLETIGTLASSIAHEFNNLLTPIMSYSILTLEGLPAGCDDLADNVAEIYEASRKARDIISRLNDLARKNPEATMRSLSLDEQVQRALNVAAPAQPASVETVTCLGSGDARIHGNGTQLSQLLLNLILNAFHAMEAGGGVLTITTAAEEGMVLLRVEDTGTGIPAGDLPRLFEPFFTTRESGKGTGLGLAIVRQVVEAHHGEITVESCLGKGTAFLLKFPASHGEQKPEA